MKGKFLPIIFCLFALSAFAQNKEAEKIDTLGKIPCGDFMARMEGIAQAWRNSPGSKIYVVYYGERYRKIFTRDNFSAEIIKIQLEYPHREDRLNWAKAIPLYLTSANEILAEIRELLKDKIVLIDGGFRENLEMEIWLATSETELPKPIPTIAEKDIKFRNDKPLKTPDYDCCYGNC